MERIYLDYQASTPLLPEVRRAMNNAEDKYFANPHASDHSLGNDAFQAVENARKQIAKEIHCEADEIIFTSGATEANNLALKGLARSLLQAGKKKIIVSSIEHKCVLNSAARLAENGFEVIYLPPNDEGYITAEALSRVIDDSVGLVSIMCVNNEIGTIQPIKALAKIAKMRGAIVHCDAAQAPIFQKINCAELNVDLLSLSSHKIYGPKGIGCLYIRRDFQEFIEPLIDGGGQENGLRSGTLPTPLVEGFSVALKIAQVHCVANAERLQNLSDYFLVRLMTAIPEIKVNGGRLRHPGNLNLCFPNVRAKEMLQTLWPAISTSTGSACNSGIESPSYVLQELGLSQAEAASSIRFSFGITQNRDEMDQAVEYIVQAYERCVSLTPSCA